MASTYNPYNAVNSITGLKGSYNNARYVNKTGNENAYAEQAKQYYQELRDNGYGSVADELEAADYDTAQSILERYSQSNDGQEAVNNFTDYTNNNSVSANENAGTYNSNVDTLLSTLKNYTTPSESTTASNSQALKNLQSLFDMVSANNTNLTDQSNNILGQMTQYGTDQSARYDDLYDYIKNTDYYSTPEGKSILQNYQLQGNTAANDSTANSASSNSGNIDSYSAANANRQQLAYTNAGNQAVLNQKNSNVGNMLSTLESLGVDMGDLYDKMVNLHQGDQSYNLGLAGEYTTGQNNTASQIQAQTDSNNSLYSDALSNLRGLYDNQTSENNTNSTNLANLTSSIYGNDTEKAINDTNNATERYSIDSDASLQKELANISANLSYYQTDKSAESELAVQESINSANKYIAELEQQGKITSEEAETERARIQAKADEYGYSTDLAGVKYKADSDLKGTMYTVDNSGSTSDTATDAELPSGYENWIDYFQDAYTTLMQDKGYTAEEAQAWINNVYPGHESESKSVYQRYKSSNSSEYN